MIECHRIGVHLGVTDRCGPEPELGVGDGDEDTRRPDGRRQRILGQLLPLGCGRIIDRVHVRSGRRPDLVPGRLRFRLAGLGADNLGRHRRFGLDRIGRSIRVVVARTRRRDECCGEEQPCDCGPPLRYRFRRTNGHQGLLSTAAHGWRRLRERVRNDLLPDNWLTCEAFPGTLRALRITPEAIETLQQIMVASGSITNAFGRALADPILAGPSSNVEFVVLPSLRISGPQRPRGQRSAARKLNSRTGRVALDRVGAG